MRTLAIDLGSRRIGLALSDFGGALATPYEVLFITDPLQAITPLLKLIEREDIKRIVVGLPLNMDGSPSPAAHAAVRWAHAGNICHRQIDNIQLIFVDERLSSFEADQQLAQRRQAGEKLTHKKKKQQQDAVAAAGFLQAFLDGKLPAINLIG